MILTVLAIVLGIGLVVGVHEACHMFMAKFFNVKVLKFAIGFGPSLLSHKIGNTSYELKLLPLGGFVQFAGESPEKLIKGGFFSLPWYKRALIALAGPISNFILGFLLILLLTVGFKGYPLLAGIQKSYSISSFIVVATLKGLGSMVVKTAGVTDIGGPVMVTKVLIDSIKVGWDQFLLVLAIISLSLGLFNLFPLPALDGGHVFLYILEGIYGKRFSSKVYEVWNIIGLLLLGALMLLTIFSDVMKLK